MTATLPSESKSPSRRALLAGALGGLGAWAAGAIGRASPVRADGENIQLGGEYGTALSVTWLKNQTNVATVFRAESASSGTAVEANSSDGIGLEARSGSFIGVSGTGNGSSGIGVYGASNSGNGVAGHSTTAIGVHGSSFANTDVGTGDKAGVLGEGTFPAGQGTASAGVWGRSTNNVGVFGQSQSSNGVSGVASTTGNGVYGTAPSGKGVWGHSSAGRGVQGSTTTGYAGYFSGKVFTTKFYELAEIGVAPAPATDRARLFVRDNGSGKTQLCVRFHTGAIRVLATEA